MTIEYRQSRHVSKIVLMMIINLVHDLYGVFPLFCSGYAGIWQAN